MTREVIISILVIIFIIIPPIAFLISYLIEEYKCKKQFKELKIGDRYATILTDAEDVFTKPEYIYVEITDKKRKR